MRVIKSLDDVQIVLKEVTQWKDRISSQNQDFKGLKIQNAGPGTEPNDYVTLSQLQQAVVPSAAPVQNFSIPFSSVGAVTAGQLSAPYIVGTDRVGNPTAISVAVPSTTESPTGVPLIINLAMNGVNMLSTNLSLPVGNEGPVSSSQFISPLPRLAIGNKIVPIIIQSGGASYVTIQLYVVRIIVSGS
jgi:hypothetical protein